MSEPFLLEAGDIIRHKKYPQGPEWKILATLETEHGKGHLLRMNPPGPFYWVVGDLLFLSKAGLCTGFTYDVEQWAMKKVNIDDQTNQGRRHDLPAQE